jgi:hypothetical protein
MKVIVIISGFLIGFLVWFQISLTKTKTAEAETDEKQRLAELTRLEARVDSLARQTAANERAFLTILLRIETKGWEPVCVDGLLAAYDYERQRIINQPANERK